MKRQSFAAVLKSIIYIYIFSSVLCLCAGCKSENKTVSDITNSALSSSSMPDFQYTNKLLGAQIPTQKSNGGYYNIINDRIIFTDTETLNSTPLCNKTDCLHTADFLDCNAKTDNFVQCCDCFQIYNNKMYYLVTDPSSDSNTEVNNLLAVSLDGTEKEIALTLNNKFIVDWFIYDGYFYYQPSVTVDNEESATVSGNFYRINLSSKKDELFIDFADFSDIFGAEGSLRNIYDGYMYLTISGYVDEKSYDTVIEGGELDDDTKTVLEIVRYSLSDGSFITIDPNRNDYDFVGFSDGKLVGADYVDKNKNIIISELDGSNPKTITATEMISQIFCDDEYIFVYSQSSDKKTITVYDKNGKTISEVYVPDEISEYISPSSMTFYDEYIWFKVITDDRNVCLNNIKKSDLFDDGQQLKYTEVYRYE